MVARIIVLNSNTDPASAPGWVGMQTRSSNPAGSRALWQIPHNRILAVLTSGRSQIQRSLLVVQKVLGESFRSLHHESFAAPVREALPEDFSISPKSSDRCRARFLFTLLFALGFNKGN
jgi:hypothetical protein